MNNSNVAELSLFTINLREELRRKLIEIFRHTSVNRIPLAWRERVRPGVALLLVVTGV